MFMLIVALGCVSAAATAQTAGTLTPSQVEIACAPPPVLVKTNGNSLRIATVQGPDPRTVFGHPERLHVKGGSAKGMQPGQLYFVRRPVHSYDYRADLPTVVQTAGWVRVETTRDRSAVVSVEHVCGEILAGDYLEPFEAPAAPATAGTPARGEPDFDARGRILFADAQRVMAGNGEYMMIDRGARHGVVAGAQFTIYRDLGVSGVPLNAIGEATAVNIGSGLSVVRIDAARDAVQSGDYVVPHKKP
jgi:hypothetical protein